MAWNPIRKDGTPAKKPGRKAIPKVVSPGKGKGKKGPRPHVWKIGAEAGKFKHDMYMPWLRAKAQANFRGEEWLLSFEEFFDIWKDDWHNRGRAQDNVCMTREDPEGPWDTKNSVLITRLEHLRRQVARQTAKGKRTYKKRGSK